MSSKTFCDICHKEIKEYSREEPYMDIRTNPFGPSMELCLKCWTNKKNWPKIHKVQKPKTKY